jgi:hypothetical protein
MYAIIKASNLLLELMITGKTIGIFSDSQACIKSLRRASSKSRIVQECINSLNALGKDNEVSVIWVKGHGTCIGNEISDRLAGKGARKRFYGPEPALPILDSVWKEDVNNWIHTEHTNRWRDLQIGTLTKRLGKYPNAKESKQLINMSRRALKGVTDILTGHCALQKHLHTLGKVDSPLCPSCGEEEEESVEHYLCLCEAFREVRQQILGKQYLRLLELSQVDSNILWSYIKATERFEEA